MDYYEELGIAPNATEEEIRKAHRRLTKLLHPDQHTDEAVKQLAETQMRRVNSIVEILYDPERRRIYDEHLREGLIPFGPPAVTVRAAPRRGAIRSLPWWIASTIAAIALTVGAVWFWADNWGSSFGNRNPTYIPSAATAEAPPAAANQPAHVEGPTPVRTPATVQVEKHRVATHAPQPQVNAKSHTVAAVPVHTPRKTLVLADNAIRIRPHATNPQVAPPPNVPPVLGTRVDPGMIPGNTLPAVASRPPDPSAPAPGEANAAPRITATVPAVAAKHNPLEGEWVYAPTEPEKRKPGFYPPQFIDLRLFWNDGGLHGTYRARYDVGDKPIPPNVDFALAPNGTNKFLWQANNGSRGTLKISAVDRTSIRIEWKTTVYSHGLALTAGTATLMRRTP